MFRRDVLKHEIQQLSRVLVRVLFLRKEDRRPEAHDEIQQAGQLFLGLDLSPARTITYGDVMAALERKAPGDADYQGHTADLLREQGELLLADGDATAARSRLLAALDLYLALDLHHAAIHDPARDVHIDRLLDALNLFTLPPETQSALFAHYEAGGNLARAEDVLFARAEHLGEQCREEGIAFFERLRRMTNTRLRKGGLSREEVAEGRAAFEALLERTRSA